jgi:hypothetical protein
MVTEGKFKELAESFHWQVSKVKPITDEKLIKDITVIVSSVPGAVKSDFVINEGDCLYRYFIENNKGLRHVKYTTSVADVVNRAIEKNNLKSVYDIGGIPVIKI